jgi:SAM-dependent methyltransferase
MARSPEELEVARLWNENAERWTRHVRAGWDRFRDVFNIPMFLEFVPDLSAKRVLDLGCGEGQNTRLFARRGARMLGIDISERMIEAARQAERQQPLGIEYWEGSFTGLSQIDGGSCDAVVSTMALMDGPDFVAAAREAYRVLRQGGGLYFSVTHPCFMTPDARWIADDNGDAIGRVVADYWRDDPFVERWAFGAAPPDERIPFAIRYFTYRLEDYINALCEAGFKITKIREPRPTEAMVAALPALAPYHRHTPIFLYIAAQK